MLKTDALFRWTFLNMENSMNIGTISNSLNGIILLHKKISYHLVPLLELCMERSGNFYNGLILKVVNSHRPGSFEAILY